MRLLATLLLLISAQLLVYSAAVTTGVPITSLTSTNIAPDAAWVVTSQRTYGKLTNDTYRIAVSNLFSPRLGSYGAINPTDERIPVRSNSTTYVDSPIYRINTNTVGVTQLNVDTLQATNLVADVVNTINVKAPPYNAAGDGVEDDTAEILAAIDSACISNKSVFLPAGTYIVASPLAITNGLVSMFGEGKSTIIKLAAGATNAVTVDPGPSNFYGVNVSDLAIDLNTQPNSTGIYFKSGGQICTASRIWVTEMGASSIGIVTASHNDVNNVKLQSIRVATSPGGSGTGYSIQADSSTLIDCDFNGGLATPTTGDGLVVPGLCTSLNIIGGELAYAKYGIRFPNIGPLSTTIMGVRMEGNTDYGYWMEGYDNTANRLRGVTIINPYVTGGTTNGIHAQAIESLVVMGGVFKDIPVDGACIDLGTYVNGFIQQGGMTDCVGPFLAGAGTNNAGLFIMDTNVFSGKLKSRVTIVGDDSVADLYKDGTNYFGFGTSGPGFIFRTNSIFAYQTVLGAASTPDATANGTVVRGAISNDNTGIGGGAVFVDDNLAITGVLSNTVGNLDLYGNGSVIARTTFVAAAGVGLGATSTPDAGAGTTSIRGPINNDNSAIGGGAVFFDDGVTISGALNATNGVSVGANTIVDASGNATVNSAVVTNALTAASITTSGTINATNGFLVGAAVGGDFTWTNFISGVITQRVTVTKGLVTNLETIAY